ncbi:hypothetical protein OROMI_006367 [Orobanche minor]
MTALVSTLFLYFILFGNAQQGPLTLNVIQFGAKPDGLSDATKPFLRAWESACAAKIASTIYVPKGGYYIRSAEFRGPCKKAIKVQIDGTFVDSMDYRDFGNPDYWILFIQVNRLTLLGGSFDAKGAGYWACKTSGQICPIGARSITFNWVNDAIISGLTSINSQLMHLVIDSCKNVKVSNVKIIAPDFSPNTDGIHVQSSTSLSQTPSSKQGMTVYQLGQGQGICGWEKYNVGLDMDIGNLGRDFNEDGVVNVTLINSVFTGSDNGLRIKTWATPSRGFVKNIKYQNIVMKTWRIQLL